MTTYEITKTFEFSASHQLLGLPEDHPCSRHHGHNYIVRVEIGVNDLDKIGFVVDYSELSVATRDLIDKLDHRHLNEILSFNPTAELLARYFAEQLASWLTARNSRAEDRRYFTLGVVVSETPKTSAYHFWGAI